MEIHDSVTVTLPYYVWMYFLGWANGFAADEDVPVQRVLNEITASVMP